MQYIITKRETKEVKLSGETMQAVFVFEKLLKFEKRVAKLEDELDKWASQIPASEIEVYVEITTELQNTG